MSPSSYISSHQPPLTYRYLYLRQTQLKRENVILRTYVKKVLDRQCVDEIVNARRKQHRIVFQFTVHVYSGM
jgi:hypothetical protein